MEKKKLNCTININTYAKKYNRPTLYEIGAVKEKTAGGSYDTAADNSGRSNKNTLFTGQEGY